MDIRSLNGKTVCVLGYGREGKAMVEALEIYAPECEITIADQNHTLNIAHCKHWKQLGEGWLQNLEKFDVLIKSPGIPPSTLPSSPHARKTTSTQIFLDSIDPRSTVIGVTGSKGKSTTASLIHAILKAAGKTSHLVGNIGEPAIAHIGDGGMNTFFVQEMSSFQLMDLTAAPKIAVIVSFFPEHLDYHGSLEAYLEAKRKITALQTSSDIVFYSDTKSVRELIRGTNAKKIPVTESDAAVAVTQTKLIGAHNQSNIAIASAVARHLSLDPVIVAQAIQAFDPLPHRLQSLGIFYGIEWVDDSISTTPESTIAAIQALAPRVQTIILGGQDRGNDFHTLAKVIASSGIEHAILMGESGKRIKSALSTTKITIHRATSMHEAITVAKKTAELVPTPNPTPNPTPPIVLLSPASPSYDMYVNFEEKGSAFADAIAG